MRKKRTGHPARREQLLGATCWAKLPGLRRAVCTECVSIHLWMNLGDPWWMIGSGVIQVAINEET